MKLVVRERSLTSVVKGVDRRQSRSTDRLALALFILGASVLAVYLTGKI